MSTDRELYAAAHAAGKDLDLTNCVYGPSHAHGGFADRPSTHYPLLAGLVRKQAARQVLEVGTHYGGSIMAMWEGRLTPDSDEQKRATRFVSIDIVMHHNPQMSPSITCLKGDALSPRVVQRVRKLLRAPIDILFVDAGHDYGQTWETIAVYANRLQPEFILVDDIRLNRSMRRLWAAIDAVPNANATDVSDVIDRKSGFGVLHPEYPCRFKEFGATRRLVARQYWRAGHAMVGLVPADLRPRVRRLLRGGS